MMHAASPPTPSRLLTPETARDFILANTRLQPVSHAPEISLWLADEVTPLWRLTEEELGEMGLPPPFWAFAWAGGQAIARWLRHPNEVKPGNKMWTEGYQKNNIHLTEDGIGALVAYLESLK